MSTPHIDDYRFGRIVIDGKSYEQDVIILPHGVLGGWWRKEGHALHPEDLDAVFEDKPDLLVVGQGAHGRMSVKRETQDALADAGIDVIAQNTAEACETYDSLRDERSVAAALHLTC